MQSKANACSPAASVRGVLLLMLVVCLVECSTGKVYLVHHEFYNDELSPGAQAGSLGAYRGRHNRRGDGKRWLPAERLVLDSRWIPDIVEKIIEQRVNSRASKASNLIQKVNGWRSQRGGSCLSYGHSCWGAHGKRSGKPPAAAPDWYITRVLRRMAASSELNREKQLDSPNDNAIYRVEDDTPSSNTFISNSDEIPVQQLAKGLEAKPMIDDNMLSKMKLWQIMRAASEEN